MSCQVSRLPKVTLSLTPFYDERYGSVDLTRRDLVFIGVPIYNFSVPAAIKAWIDMIARTRLTFRYTENGPEGLLNGKKAYVVVSSGGVPVDSRAA